MRGRRSAWIIVALTVAGCAETAASPPQAQRSMLPAAARPAAPEATVRAHGLTVRLPPGWQSAPESLTPHLVDPREELAAGTFPLRYHGEGTCSHLPVSALEDLGPGDAFVTLQERGLGVADDSPGFPARPTSFGPQLGGPSEADTCTPSAHFTGHWFGFSDGGRHFHVLVAFGPDASADVQRQAWAILDSLSVDPGVIPDWRSSG